MTDTPTRQLILDAAATLYRRQGHDATPMEQVRQAAGVSNGSLYHHFRTKSELARALYESALADYHAALIQALTAPSQATATAADAEPDAQADRTHAPALQPHVDAKTGVRQLVLAHIDWVVAHTERAAVLHDLRRHAAVARSDDIGRLNASAMSHLHDWLTARVQAGELLAMPLSVWVALVFAPVLQLTPQWLRKTPVDVPMAVRHLLADAAWRAVSPPLNVSE